MSRRPADFEGMGTRYVGILRIASEYVGRGCDRFRITANYSLDVPIAPALVTVTSQLKNGTLG